MAKKPTATWLIDDVADFLTAQPSREEMLAFRPSRHAQGRLNSLMERSKQGSLSTDEEWELKQFEHLEILLQAVKARLRSPRTVPPTDLL